MQDDQRAARARGQRMSSEDLDLSEALAEVLQVCLRERGFHPPLHLAVVGRNGSCMFTRYMSGSQGILKAQVLAEHAEEGLLLPVNVMVTDASGADAVHVTIDSETRQPRFTH